MNINGTNVCIGCMKPLEKTGGCSFCGMKQEEYNPIPRCLLPGTKVANRYILGKVLGEGSFGITYIGWDETLGIPVAVKEYFPSEMVSRDVICGNGNEVYLYENSKKDRYQEDLKKFLNEARCLSKFNEVEGIVSVLDFFYENNTAYIVMQFIDGVSVKEYVREKGKMSGSQVLEAMGPVLLALERVHGSGIVHRDISPDNIMIKKDGSLVLIDFGAARLRNIDNTKTMTVLFKRGFSPEEQYRYKGRWGAYTDVYSISATMYFMLTGVTPTDSVIRALGDDMPSLVSMKELELSVKQRKAIMKGMAVNAQNRWQSISELHEALYKEEQSGKPVGNKGKWPAFYACVAITVLVAVFGSWWYLKASSKKSNVTKSPEYGTTEVVRKLPANTPLATVEPMISTPEVTEKKVAVTKEKEKTEVPDVVGLKVSRAKEKLKKSHLKYKIKYQESEKKKGLVLSQSVKKGKMLSYNATISLTVSKGKATVTPAPTKKPSSQNTKKKETKDMDFVGVIQ